MISASQKSSSRGRASTTVTRDPSAANIEAYSMPITPAPTTRSASGIFSRCRIPSESSTVRSLNSTLVGRAGRVPTAITIFSAVTWRLAPSSPETVTVWSSEK